MMGVLIPPSYPTPTPRTLVLRSAVWALLPHTYSRVEPE